MEFNIKLLNGETRTVRMGSDHVYRITTFIGDEWEERRRFFTGVHITKVSPSYMQTLYKNGYNNSRHRFDYNDISLDEIENIEEIAI